MKYRRKHKIPFLRIGALLGVIAVLIVPIVVAYLYLPSKIRVRVGEEHLFNFELPLKGMITEDYSLKVEDINSNKTIKDYIDLNRPFSVTMDEEGEANMKVSLFGVIPIKTVGVEAVDYKEVIPSGNIVGIKVDTDGILVLGVGEFETEIGQVSPCKGIVEKGDLILSCNETNLRTKEDLKKCIENSDSTKLKLNLIRQGECKEVEVETVYSKVEDVNKIGLWIKDSTQGIGTVTYIEPTSGAFGALGHGITEQNTQKIIPVKGGEIMNASIIGIKKGERGNPGEVSGIIDYSEDEKMGVVSKNNPLGIYGKVNEKMVSVQQMEPMPVAFQDEINEGMATILVDLTGDGPQEYEVEIQKVSRYSSEPAKSMVIKIVDENLLKLTNGIVQGMSGSPILQDGKIIGAVTHVFVNDPTRGYGIFIENMLDTGDNISN